MVVLVQGEVRLLQRGGGRELILFFDGIEIFMRGKKKIYLRIKKKIMALQLYTNAE